MSGINMSESWPLCCVSLPSEAVDGASEVMLEVRCERWPDDGDGGRAVVSVAGELCHFSAPQAFDSLRGLAETATGLVIDLSEVSFLDAGGISLLVALHELAVDRGAGWELRAPSATVTWMLELVRLDHTLMRSQPTEAHVQPTPPATASTG